MLFSLKKILAAFRGRLTAEPWFVASAAVIALIVTPWLMHSGYLLFTDFIWGPNPDVSWHKNGAPLRALMIALGNVLPPDAVEKTLIVGILFLLASAGAAVAKSQTADRRVIAVIALFFLCNPFVYDRLGYGQVYMLIGLGCLGLGAAALFEHLATPHAPAPPVPGWARRFDRRVLSALVWFGIAVQFSPHYLFLAAAVGAVWLGVLTARRETALLRTLPLTIVAGALLFAALNLNWLWPSGSSGSTAAKAERISVEELQVFATSGRTSAEAFKNVTLLTGFWGKDQQRYLDLTRDSRDFGRSFILLLPLFVWGAWSAYGDRRRPLAVGLAAAGVVSLCLAVGYASPLTRSVTVWLFDHVPFYAGLRETQKWAAVLALVYAVLLAWGAEKFLLHKRVANHAATMAWMIGGVAVMQVPLLLWGMGGSVRPTQYPPDWTQVDTLVRGDSCDGKRILFLPWHLYMGFRWTDGAIIASPAADFFSCPVRQGTNMEFRGIRDNSGNVEGAVVAEWIAQKGKTDALATLGITHVAVAKDADWSAYSWLAAVPELQLLNSYPTIDVYGVKAPQKNAAE